MQCATELATATNLFYHCRARLVTNIPNECKQGNNFSAPLQNDCKCRAVPFAMRWQQNGALYLIVILIYFTLTHQLKTRDMGLVEEIIHVLSSSCSDVSLLKNAGTLVN